MVYAHLNQCQRPHLQQQLAMDLSKCTPVARSRPSHRLCRETKQANKTKKVKEKKKHHKNTTTEAIALQGKPLELIVVSTTIYKAMKLQQRKANTEDSNRDKAGHKLKKSRGPSQVL